MRLPLVAPLESRDGVSNKDARFTNMLAEENELGQMQVVKRPGLVPVATPTGAAQGLCEFDGDLITIFNASLGFASAAVSETLTPSMLGSTALYPDSACVRKGDVFLSVGGYTGGVYDDKVKYSTDATTWSSYSDGGWGNSSYGPMLLADDVYFYAVIRSLTEAKVYRSSDGSAWTLMQTVTSANFPWFVAWDDGLYYYDGDAVYRSTDGAATFSLYGTRTSGTYTFDQSPICGGKVDGVYYVYDSGYLLASSADKINFALLSNALPSALSTYSNITGVFADDFLFLACYQDATHTYVARVAVPSADYVLSSVIADQPSDHSSGYADSFLMFSGTDYVYLPGGSGVWRTPIQTTQATTITTIGALAGSEMFDFAQSTL